MVCGISAFIFHFSPIGFRDSLEDKSKVNLVQIKGRFSVTSENVDLVKVQLCSFDTSGLLIRLC